MGGFYHGSVNSDAYMILAGGGYKSVSDFLTGQDHYKTSPGAGTAGTSSATSGSTLAVPYVTVNANGHVTGYGTHTHTITGFAAEHSHPYLPTAGGTMTGTIIMNGASFEQTGKRWMYGSTRNSGFKYDYNGNEAFIISAGSYASAAISLYSGSRLALNDSNGQWNATVADMQIKLNCVGIGANVDTAYKLYVNGTIKSSGFYHSSVLSDSYVLLAGGGYKAISDFSTTDTNTWRKVLLEGIDKLGTGTGTNPLNIKAGTGMSITESNGTFTFNCTVSGSSDVYWKDVKDKIRHGNEFNIVPSGYNSSMWFNYRSDADTNVTVSEYIFGNGKQGIANLNTGTVYPNANGTYYMGTSSNRWICGFFTDYILIGTTNYTSSSTAYDGAYLGRGYMELNAVNPFIDFHYNRSTSDYTTRLIQWDSNNRLTMDSNTSSLSGYIATCEGNSYNIVCLGVITVYRTSANTTSWNVYWPFGLVDGEVVAQPADLDYYSGSTLRGMQYGLILRIKPHHTYANSYTRKYSLANIIYATATTQAHWFDGNACLARTRGWDGGTAFDSYEISINNSTTYGSGYGSYGRGPDYGNILAISARRPIDHSSNTYIGAVQYDGLLEQGNGSIASFRIALFGYMS